MQRIAKIVKPQKGGEHFDKEAEFGSHEFEGGVGGGKSLEQSQVQRGGENGGGLGADPASE